MALTILKNKSATKGKVVAVSALATLIDDVGKDYGDALKTLGKIKALQESLKPFNVKFKALQDMVNGLDAYDADAEFVEKGEAFEVSAGVRENNREISDMKAVRKKLGDETFFTVAKLTLKDLDRYVAEAEQVKLGLIKKSRGARKIDVRAIRE